MENSKTKQKISILFPLDMLAKMRESAKQHQRSFNGEVIWALRQYLEEQEKRGQEK